MFIIIVGNHLLGVDATKNSAQEASTTMTYCSDMGRATRPNEDLDQFESQFESPNFHFNGGLSPTRQGCNDFSRVDMENLELMDILNYSNFADW